MNKFIFIFSLFITFACLSLPIAQAEGSQSILEQKSSPFNKYKSTPNSEQLLLAACGSSCYDSLITCSSYCSDDKSASDKACSKACNIDYSNCMIRNGCSN